MISKPRFYASLILIIQGIVFLLYFFDIFVMNYELPGFDRNSNMIENLYGKYTGFEGLNIHYNGFFTGMVLSMCAGIMGLHILFLVTNRIRVRFVLILSYFQVLFSLFLILNFSFWGFVMLLLIILSLLVTLIYDRKTTKKDSVEIMLRNVAIGSSLVVLALYALIISMTLN